MTLPFQRDPIQLGKFYVSDNGPVKRGPPDKGDKPSPSRDDSRVRGPFNTWEEAEASRQSLIEADPNLKGNRLYVWPAAIRIPIGKFQDVVRGKIPDFDGHKLDEIKEKAKAKGVIITSPDCPDQVPTFDGQGKYRLDPIGPPKPRN